MNLEHYGEYPVRRISHGESVIHLPKHVTGKFAIYVNDDASVIILRKQGPLNMKRLEKDLDAAEAGAFVPLEDAMRQVRSRRAGGE